MIRPLPQNSFLRKFLERTLPPIITLATYVHTDRTKVVIDFGKVANLAIQNGVFYRFFLNQQPPSVDPLPVYAKIGEKLFKVMTNGGNNLMSDQLRMFQDVAVVYGNNPPHFLIFAVLRGTIPDTSAKPNL